MRLHRFYVSHITNEPLRAGGQFIAYDAELIHQLRDVFRMKAGDRVILLDNSGCEFESEIASLAKSDARFSVGASKVSQNMPKAEVVLLVALIKKDNFEWVLEKGTELGVSAFIPILADRTEKKELNFERATKIVREASEQSGRGTLPMIYDMMGLEGALDKMQVRCAAFHPEGRKFDRAELLEGGKSGLLIGPEGGWTDRELALFKERNVAMYSLGPAILRAETAAIAASALLLLG